VRTDGVGDVLMTAPALRALARSGPLDRSITVLGSPQGVEAARLLPDVDATIAYRAPWTGVAAAGDVDDDLEAIEAVRAGGFDAAVIFTVNTQSALPAATLCRLAGVPRRLAHSRENPYALLTDWVPEPEPGVAERHEVRRQLDLVAHVGAPEAGVPRFRPSRGERERARTLLGRSGVDAARPWLLLHPGAAAPSRRYPAEAFAAAADRLVDLGWQVLVSGGPADEPAVRAVRRAMRRPPPRLPSTLSLPELASVLSLAPVAVTNNTGPAHVAALVGTPAVVLYALTNPQHAPWGVEHRLLFRDVACRNCLRSVCPEGHHACLRDVPPEAVVGAVAELAVRPPSTDPRAPSLVPV
jgi:ADP-heptose:LPS heptosyltransferase